MIGADQALLHESGRTTGIPPTTVEPLGSALEALATEGAAS